MRRQGKKEYSSVFGVARALFYFLSLLVSCASRLTPVTCVNQIQENSKMGKGGERKREYRSEQWAANWQLSRRHWESLYRPDYRSRRLLFFFFLFFIGSFTVKRRLFVSRHAEDVSLFRLFFRPLLNRASGNIPPLETSERKRIFRNRYLCDLDFRQAKGYGETRSRNFPAQKNRFSSREIPNSARWNRRMFFRVIRGEVKLWDESKKSVFSYFKLILLQNFSKCE